MHDQKKRPEKKGNGDALRGEEKKKKITDVFRKLYAKTALSIALGVTSSRPRRIEEESITIEKKEVEGNITSATENPMTGENDIMPFSVTFTGDDDLHMKRELSPSEMERVRKTAAEFGIDLDAELGSFNLGDEPTELKGGLVAISEDGRKVVPCRRPGPTEDSYFLEEVPLGDIEVKFESMHENPEIGLKAGFVARVDGISLHLGYNEDDLIINKGRDVSPVELEEIERKAAELGLDLRDGPIGDKYVTIYDPQPTDGEISLNVKSDLPRMGEGEPVILDDLLDGIYPEPDESKNKKPKK